MNIGIGEVKAGDLIEGVTAEGRSVHGIAVLVHRGEHVIEVREAGQKYLVMVEDVTGHRAPTALQCHKGHVCDLGVLTCPECGTVDLRFVYEGKAEARTNG